MAENYEINISTHNSIYTETNDAPSYGRKAKVYFSIPQKGTDSDTGILLLIAGFGGHANSNVHKQMREKFADEYNLVTLQCDYFGFEFMQDLKDISIVDTIDKLKQGTTEKFSEEIDLIFPSCKFSEDGFISVANKIDFNLSGNVPLPETKEYFADMGFLQAIDNINAVLNVINILYDNNLPFNSRKIIAYGNSQGAYLAYLCHALSQTIFTMVIDNSAWLYPKYAKNYRSYNAGYNKSKLLFTISYLAKQMMDNAENIIFNDEKILDLRYLYSAFENNCKIICYHGTNDAFISGCEKKDFGKIINDFFYCEISDNEVDGSIFKSSGHGLDADFKKMFSLVMDKYGVFSKSNTLNFSDEIIFSTEKAEYKISYKNIYPEITINQTNTF